MEDRHMQNWQKSRNYRKYENPDGSFTYVVTVDGEEVEVSAEVYSVFAAAERKMEYMELDLKRDRVLQDADGRAVLDENGYPVALPEREVSLDKLIDEDWDYPSSESSPEDAVIGRLEIDALHSCLDLLGADERELIGALFFKGLTEREYAKMLGISKTALHARKVKVLAKIKTLLEQ
jgi:RNA polymerase sigma factor (sigma-70 family)